MSHTHFRVNPHSIAAWMSRNSLHLITCTSGLNRYLCFNFRIIIYCFACQFSLCYYWYWYIRSSRPVVFCKKMFLRILQNSPENTYAKFSFLMKLSSLFKKEIPAQLFSCEFCKVCHNTFFNKLFRWLLLHKHSLCVLSHHDILPFQKRYHTDC